MQEISNKSTIAVCSSYCIPENTQPVHHDMEVHDMLQFSRECIFQECKECLNGKKIIPHIKEANDKLNWEKASTWHKWKDVVKTVNGKLCKAFEQILFTSTLEILLEGYRNHLLVMSTHLFHFEWQGTKFSEKLDNLVSGEVLFVIDFARNHAHWYDGEPQSAHWDRMQSTMHPVVSCYKCTSEGCKATVTDEVLHFTSDLRHDGCAVQEFKKRTIQHLKDSKIPVHCIIKFSDNANLQYKSKIPFDILSKSDVPIMRNFFGEKHGKSTADGVIGRNNQFLSLAVRNCHVLGNAEELAEFCTKQLTKKPTGTCQHYRQHFFYTEHISRSEESAAETTKDTRKIHSVRSTGINGIIEVRDSVWFCPPCLNGYVTEECQNRKFVGRWERRNIYTKKILPSEENTHWLNVHDENHPPPHHTLQRKVPSPSLTSPSPTSTSQRQIKVPPATQMANINRTPTPTQQCPVRRQGNLVLTEEQRWEQILEDMRKCKNYDELEELVRSITIDFHIQVQDNTTYSEQSFFRDNVARAKYPSDTPRDLTPLNCESDGNCFLNSVLSIV